MPRSGNLATRQTTGWTSRAVSLLIRALRASSTLCCNPHQLLRLLSPRIRMSTNITSRAYNKTWYGLLSMLVVVGVGLFVVVATQGPRLRRVSVDKMAVVTKPDQSLVMYATQPLLSVASAQISITPHVAFTATTNAETISLLLSQRLQ